MRLIDADKLDMSVKVDGDRTLSPISQLIAQTIIENAQTIESDEDCISRKTVMKVLCNNCELCEDGVQTCFSKCEEYHFLATLPSIQPKPKADVLDKIRAEIEALEDGISSYHNDRPWIYKDEVLDIIDKYKAESEDKK